MPRPIADQDSTPGRRVRVTGDEKWVEYEIAVVNPWDEPVGTLRIRFLRSEGWRTKSNREYLVAVEPEQGFKP